MFESHLLEGPQATFRAGRELAPLLSEGVVIGLVGNLGAGKTLLVQGLASGLNVPAKVRITSPTFSLINEYRGGRLPMVHVDLYRIEEAGELVHIGLEEMLENEGVSAVEWCDRFDVLPDDHVLVEISIDSQTSRGLSARGTGPTSAAIVEAWRKALGI